MAVRPRPTSQTAAPGALERCVSFAMSRPVVQRLVVRQSSFTLASGAVRCPPGVARERGQRNGPLPRQNPRTDVPVTKPEVEASLHAPRSHLGNCFP